MHSVNWLFKYLNGIRFKNRYERLTKAENAKAVRVPRGQVPLYVGKEEKRCEVPMKYLSLWSFKELFAESQSNKLDIYSDSPIVLACDTENSICYLGRPRHTAELSCAC